MDFLPDLTTLVAYSLAVTFLTFTPGPDMTFFLGKAMAQGRAAGFSAFAGAASGLVLHSMLVAVGLSAILAASVTAFTVLKVAGALYLLYLAVEALRHGGRFALEGGAAAREPLKAIYLKGLAINILNPKIIIFFMTFLPQFIEPGDIHAGGKLLFLGLWFILVAIPLTVPMILGAESIARFLRRRPRAIKAVDYGFAGVMGAFAVKLLLARTT